MTYPKQEVSEQHTNLMVPDHMVCNKKSLYKEMVIIILFGHSVKGKVSQSTCKIGRYGERGC